MARIGVIVSAIVAGLAGAAVAGVAIRDAVYWERPLPGVQLLEVDLASPVAVVVQGNTYDVRPGEALMVDAVATQTALVRTGHDSLLRRVRRSSIPARRRCWSTPCWCRARGGGDRNAPLGQLPKPRRARSSHAAASTRCSRPASRPGDRSGAELPDSQRLEQAGVDPRPDRPAFSRGSGRRSCGARTG